MIILLFFVGIQKKKIIYITHTHAKKVCVRARVFVYIYATTRIQHANLLSKNPTWILWRSFISLYISQQSAIKIRINTYLLCRGKEKEREKGSVKVLYLLTKSVNHFESTVPSDRNTRLMCFVFGQLLNAISAFLSFSSL